MLIRQKIILALLSQAKKPLSSIVFVKLIFLLDKKTTIGYNSAYYDFVPYKYGPFSFTLYRELDNLRRYGYIASGENKIQLNGDLAPQINNVVKGLPKQIIESVKYILARYANTSQDELLSQVYSEYPWFATNSELTKFIPPHLPKSLVAEKAVYTLGYQNRSVETFFNILLRQGIQQIIDVRANPISRRYGFAKIRMAEIGNNLGIEYQHVPELGISSRDRANLHSEESYRRLFDVYENGMLPDLKNEIQATSKLMQQRPSVLVCMEAEVKNCHRGRLANSISAITSLDIIHL